MKLFILIFSLCLIDRSDQIINGLIADVNDFKYQVALIVSNSHLCGGAIIDEYHILTAAHCIFHYSSSQITIVAGVSELNGPNSITKEVINTQIHPNYSDEFRLYETTESIYIPPLHDVAVITVSKAFNLGDRFEKIALPSPNIDYCGICTVAGWGAKEVDGSIPDRLRFTELYLSSQEKCEEEGIPHSFHEFCAYDPWQTSIPTFGDSGSPLNCDGTVWGINVWGSTDPTFPTVFVSVYDHLDFINESLSDTDFIAI